MGYTSAWKVMCFFTARVLAERAITPVQEASNPSFKADYTEPYHEE
jgi:hypothetical protein